MPLVDIDVEPLSGGGTPLLTNDGTDVNGNFTTTLPAGLYRVFFKPLPPPTTTLLTVTVEPVTVLGATAMGVITLPIGVSVSGRVIDSGGFPIANQLVAVTDVASGDRLVMKNDHTSAFGTFSVAVPRSAVTVDLDPIGIVGRTLAPRRFSLTSSANVDLGDVTLVDGFVLSGTLKNSLGAPVNLVDMDVFDHVTGIEMFTPHDNTNNLGKVAMVLPPGTYDVEGAPSFASHLVAFRAPNIALLANVDTGVTTLENGVVLSGRVRDVNGVRVIGVDVDVKRSTGVKVITKNDDTNAVGHYSVIVPRDTLSVGFAFADQHGTSGEDLHNGVLVTANLTLDGVLPRPLAGFTGAPTAGVAPLLVSFQDQSTGAVVARSWDFGDFSTPSTLEDPTHTYDFAGTYTVRLTVNGPGGPNTLTKLSFVSVTGAPPPAPAVAFVGAPTTGLLPLTVQFTNQSSGIITSHAWTFGDGTSSTLASPSHKYTKAGSYTVSLTETGPGGASTFSRQAYIVVTAPPPVAAFTGTPTSGPAPLRVQFTNQSTGVITANLWNFGDGKTSIAKSPAHFYRASGVYTVSLTETGPGGSNTVTKVAFIAVP